MEAIDTDDAAMLKEELGGLLFSRSVFTARYEKERLAGLNSTIYAMTSQRK